MFAVGNHFDNINQDFLDMSILGEPFLSPRKNKPVYFFEAVIEGSRNDLVQAT
jgi:hypothetical protein